MRRLFVIAIALGCAGQAFAQAPSFDEFNRNLREVNRDLEARSRDLIDHLERQGEAEQRRLDADYTHRQMNTIIMELQPPY